MVSKGRKTTGVWKGKKKKKNEKKGMEKEWREYGLRAEKEKQGSNDCGWKNLMKNSKQ